MKRKRRDIVVGLLFLGLTLSVAACAQQVEDIDRTQSNRILKADLNGEWYMLETVTHVPANSAATFIGETSSTEKIVWVVEEDYLFAYRSYPRFPGGDDLDGEYEYDEPGYHESPVAAFSILSHFDIQRQYDASTGEQSNVITENTSDRPWYEREYMRVDWSYNLITNWDFISEWLATPVGLSFTQDQERNLENSLYFERRGDELVYFDLPRRLLVEPDLWGCAYSWSWYGLGVEDCTAAEIEVVTSFARTEGRRDYEPLPYDDRMMNRFGFFRSERYTYDSQRGVLESGRQKLAQRFNIWEETYERDSSGDFLTSDDGSLIPIPMAERGVRTIPYYLNHRFSDDPLLIEGAVNLVEEWSLYTREGVLAVYLQAGQDVSLEDIPDVFVLCHNPVEAGDDEACGTPGFNVREGDLRYSMLWLVDSEQIEGPLGYGPNVADPETGEVISGKAHIYGAGVNTYASYGVDVIRFMNGDLEPEELIRAAHVRDSVLERAEQATDLDRISSRLRDVPLGAWREREREQLDLREQRREDLRPFDRTAVLQRIEAARQAGLTHWVAGEETERALAAELGVPVEDLTAEQRRQHDPVMTFNPTALNQQYRRRMRAISRGVCFSDLFDPNVLGLARAYEGRTDYDQIWREIRANVFYATALHEVGHTVGLRHNFSGTYDSMNYFDEYWDLRQENLITPTNTAELYELAAITEDQIDGRMREFQYSSIMDYGITFNTDFHGGGRYDRAAMVFGYTAGSNAIPLGDMSNCTGAGRVPDPEDSGVCLVRTPGFVEIYAKNQDELGDAGDILTSRDEIGQYLDDQTTLNVPYLERWHYSTVMQAFPQITDAFDRQWMRLDHFIDAREGGAENMPVRVPYLFCSDEWYEGLLSCQVFDAGADPFEQTMNLVYDYRTYYYFRDFKRDRLGWWSGSPMRSYYYYIFLPASNYFQNWYLSPDGFDDVFDDYYRMSINLGFNMLAEALATPEYGTYCTQPNGELYHLSDDAGQDREQTRQYYLDAYCDADQPFYNVPQGWGRSRWTRYDTDAGFNFGSYPIEAGHVWTSMAAIWALTDPEAFVVGSEGDAGTYSISHLDFFGDEIYSLVNAMLTEDYSVHSPVLEVTDTSGTNPTGVLHYPVIAGYYDYDTRSYFNPETGESRQDALGPGRARIAMCEPCELSSDCNGYNGSAYGNGGMFCVRGIDSEDSSARFCILDCDGQEDGFCPAGTHCSTSTWCVPDEEETCSDLVSECGPSNNHGTCPVGESCLDGECIDLWPTVQSDTSLSQVDDWIFWGMLYSTMGWETRFNDQIFVFKMGTNEEVQPGPGFEVVTFTDPILGDEYGAIREDCSVETVDGGPVGICGECEEHEDCQGWVGLFFGGTFCIELDGVNVCLNDCDSDATECDVAELDGYECEEVDDPVYPGNYCVPDAAEGCTDVEQPCSETAIRGFCDAGSTCVEGVCRANQAASALCKVGWSEVPGGAQMVLRGQEMVQSMNDNLNAWAEYNGDDEAQDDWLYRQYSRDKYGVEWVMMELNTIRAVYDFFGKVY